jgi:hypothetical protein
VGLLYTLVPKFPDVGYFRPFASDPRDPRIQLVREVFGIKDPPESMYGATMDEAVDFVSRDREDKLLEQIVDKFLRCGAVLSLLRHPGVLNLGRAGRFMGRGVAGLSSRGCDGGAHANAGWLSHVAVCGMTTRFPLRVPPTHAAHAGCLRRG